MCASLCQIWSERFLKPGRSKTFAVPRSGGLSYACRYLIYKDYLNGGISNMT
ncbi:Uncharacterized protein dnm_044480 [Desulfonema magnum]|uniref:Uncharacterized protein n=1 Tax=Desulfonema magnum TaxID=45655 RepID=A0A975BMT8_9BACT|nr:Uncharacterized protein dnm_044480 [Desulfonema magnum]